MLFPKVEVTPPRTSATPQQVRPNSLVDSLRNLGVKIPDNLASAWEAYVEAAAAKGEPPPSDIAWSATLTREWREHQSGEVTTAKRAAWRAYNRARLEAGPELYTAVGKTLTKTIKTADQERYVAAFKLAAKLRGSAVATLKATPKVPSWFWTVGNLYPAAVYAESYGRPTFPTLQEHFDEWKVGLQTADQVLANIALARGESGQAYREALRKAEGSRFL